MDDEAKTGQTAGTNLVSAHYHVGMRIHKDGAEVGHVSADFGTEKEALAFIKAVGKINLDTKPMKD